MTKKEARQTAAGAARSEMRKMGLDPKIETADSALAILDDLLRSEPQLIASKWYAEASDRQIATFEREWKARQQRGH